MKRFRQYLEEDAKRDTAFRVIADKLYIRVYNLLKNPSQRFKYVFLGKRSDEGPLFYCLELIKVQGASERFNKLNLTIEMKEGSTIRPSGEKKFTHGSFSTTIENKDLIIIYALPPAWDFNKRSNDGKVAGKFKKQRETFIHEVIHLMDKKRWKNPDNYFDKIDKVYQSTSDYMSNPKEFNAFYQAAVSYFEKVVYNEMSLEQRMNLVKLREKDYIWFLDLIRKYADIDRYDEKYKKKWIKRLTGFWDHLMKRIKIEIKEYEFKYA